MYTIMSYPRRKYTQQVENSSYDVRTQLFPTAYSIAWPRDLGGQRIDSLLLLLTVGSISLIQSSHRRGIWHPLSVTSPISPEVYICMVSELPEGKAGLD